MAAGGKWIGGGLFPAVDYNRLIMKLSFAVLFCGLTQLSETKFKDHIKNVPLNNGYSRVSDICRISMYARNSSLADT